MRRLTATSTAISSTCLRSRKPGDLERFREAKAEMQRRDPFLITAAPYHIDLLEAHALELGGKKTEAAAIISKWSNNADAQLHIPKFWLGVPNGQDVIDTWNRMK